MLRTEACSSLLRVYARRAKPSLSSAFFAGCGDELGDFVDGESLVGGADVVIWYEMTFHHIPRDEDEPHMFSHWSGFELVPRDWTSQSNVPADGMNNQVPILDLSPRTDQAGAAVAFSFAATDADGDLLTWSVGGLPAGISADASSGALSRMLLGLPVSIRWTCKSPTVARWPTASSCGQWPTVG